MPHALADALVRGNLGTSRVSFKPMLAVSPSTAASPSPGFLAGADKGPAAGKLWMLPHDVMDAHSCDAVTLDVRERQRAIESSARALESELSAKAAVEARAEQIRAYAAARPTRGMKRRQEIEAAKQAALAGAGANEAASDPVDQARRRLRLVTGASKSDPLAVAACDGVHMTAAGHKIVAALLLQTLAEAIQLPSKRSSRAMITSLTGSANVAPQIAAAVNTGAMNASELKNIRAAVLEGALTSSIDSKHGVGAAGSFSHALKAEAFAAKLPERAMGQTPPLFATEQELLEFLPVNDALLNL